MAMIDELFIALGFKIDDKKLKDLDKNVKTTVTSLKRLGAIAVGAVVALDRMANSLTKNNQAFINFNRQTGIAISQLNKVTGAGALVDVNFTADKAMQGMQALESNLAQIRLGQGDIAPFQLLGISPVGKNAAQVIEDLRVAIRGVDDMTAVNLIQQMGLSPEFISLLRMTKQEYEDFSATAQQFMLNDEQRQALQAYGVQLRLVHMEMSYLKDKALLKILPYLITLEQRLMTVGKFLIKIRGWLVGLGATGVAVMMAMDKSIKILGITINRAVGKWILLFTALYLILEDIAYWYAGKGSLLGDIIGEKKDKDATEEKRDETYERLYGKKRGWGQKYADWVGQGGFLGTIFHSQQRDTENMQRMEEILQQGNPFQQLLQQGIKTNANGGLGQVNQTKTINQTNNISFAGQDNNNIASAISDLTYAYIQADRVV